MIRFLIVVPVALLSLSSCVTVPEGPTVMALPGSGKSFDEFRHDDTTCRQYASGQVGGASPAQTAQKSGINSALLGTALGAVAGAAIDGRSGAATGAGVGLLAGALAGTGAAGDSAYGLQRGYDAAYIQCMYAKGDKVPVSGPLTSAPSDAYYPPASPGY